MAAGRWLRTMPANWLRALNFTLPSPASTITHGAFTNAITGLPSARPSD